MRGKEREEGREGEVCRTEGELNFTLCIHIPSTLLTNRL